jgi:hypothetical protein
MGVKEIATVGDAAFRIQYMFGDCGGLRDDYAKMAAFLSDENEVKASLVKVSGGIWDEYRKSKYEGTSNRFTQAIIRYAVRFGFKCQDNVVFTGPLSDQVFTDAVRKGILWKDTFAPQHGEFSHTFQWLAAGQALGWGTKTVELYKKCIDIKSACPMFGRVNNQVTELSSTVLWAYLVDCFPSTNNPNLNDQQDNIFSDTCRTPNNITKLILTMDETTFIRLYLDHRQNYRLTAYEKEGKGRNVYERTGTPWEQRDLTQKGVIPNKSKPSIQAIKSATSARYEQDNTWHGDGPTESVTTESGINKTTHRVFSKPIKDGMPSAKNTGLVLARFLSEDGALTEGRIPDTVPHAKAIDK